MAANPIDTAISSIILKSNDNVEFDINVFKSNEFCQFERLEMEESVLNVFPKGALVLRDKSDIMTYIAIKQIKSIQVEFQNGEKFLWYITSLNYTNNAASEVDQSFIVVYFTNSLYQQSQNISFYDEKIFEINPETEQEEEVSSTSLWPFSYPFVTTPDHILKTYGTRAVFNKPLFPIRDSEGEEVNLKGCGVNLFIQNTQEPVNYILFRPRIADPERIEQYQTNIITYLNYIFTYAVNEDRKPYYLFWTDFSNCLNYKFFDLRKDLESGKYAFNKDNTDPGKVEAYAVYNSDDIGRSFKIEEQDVICKKVYVMITNPSHSIVDKNYYYIRSSPIYLEQSSHELSGSVSDVERLMSPYLSEAANTTLTTITTYTTNDSPGVTYAFRVESKKDSNLVNLPDQGFWGYAKDFNIHNVTTVNITDAVGSYENTLNYIEATPLGLRDAYFTEAGEQPLYPFNDNRYIWQFQYDLTRTHPNIIRGSSGGQTTISEKDFFKDIRDILEAPSSGSDESDISSDLLRNELKRITLNKVMEAKYTAMQEQEFYDNHRRVLLEKVEKENFVANVLCCIGREIVDKEDWFFAKITGFAEDRRQILKPNLEPEVASLNNAWIYSWKRLEPGPVIGGLTGGTASKVEIQASMHSMFHGWTMSTCYGSTGMPTDSDITNMIQGKGFTGISTWAVNLNERLNCVTNNNSLASYLGPGIDADNLQGTNFRLKPIGYTGASYTDQNKGSGEQIVKMFKISVNELRQMGALLPVSAFEGEYVYYFDKENAVDGAC
jgi:hypothetical protein